MIGERIKQLRKIHNMSLTGLTAASGVSKGYLHLIEKGESSPTIDKLMQIARAFGVTFTELIGELDIEGVEPISQSLREFAKANTLPPEDVAVLSAVWYRGRCPETQQEWRIIYNTIKAICE